MSSSSRHSIAILFLLCACTGHVEDPAGEPGRRPQPAGTSGTSGSSQPPAADGGAGGAGDQGGAAGSATGTSPGRVTSAGSDAMSARGGRGASGAAATGGASGTMDEGAAGAGGGEPPTTSPATRVYGVTLDAVDALDDIVTSLKMLSRRPTARVVFDLNSSTASYARAVQRIHQVAGVMGELLDSFSVNSVSVEEYTKRTSDYLDALGDNVDIWEIGNEINGEWLGDSSDVSAKITGAYRLVKARGKPTALTLYFNQYCFTMRDHEMFRWTTDNVDPELKNGLDYVLVSYYDDDCPGPTPDWNDVFTRLAKIFPNSKLGFGECGTADRAKKAEFVQRYYALKVNLPQYVGGYFWWYYLQDMTPYTSDLWSVLNTTLQVGP